MSDSGQSNGAMRPFLAISAAIVVGALLVDHYLLRSTRPDGSAARAADAKDFAQTKRAALGAQLLISAARNPDSFKLVSAAAMPDGAICYEYRAQNGFGGMNVDYAVLGPKSFKPEPRELSAAPFNRYCNHKTGTDITDSVEQLLAVASR